MTTAKRDLRVAEKFPYKVGRAAWILGISQEQLRRLCRARPAKIGHVKVGAQYRFSYAHLSGFIKEVKAGATR